MKIAQFAVAILVTVISGCIVLPYPTASQALPELGPYIPEDLGKRDDEVLVLIHSYTMVPSTKHWDAAISAPVFIKGKNLPSLMESLKLESGYGVFVGVLLGGGGGFHWERRTRLQALCVITADGEEIGLTPASGQWLVTRKQRLSPAERDAIVSGLRTGAQNFGWPCDIGYEVNVDWPEPERVRVLEFLDRMPVSGEKKP